MAHKSVQWVEDVGRAQHDSRRDAPFFLPDTDPGFSPTAPTAAYVKRVQDLAEQLYLPPMVKYAYLHLADPTREFRAQGWTWMGVDAVEARVSLYEQHGQPRIADLAFRYAGMGHVEVLTLDRITGGVFMRNDGGVNNWERTAGWRRALELRPTHTQDLTTLLGDLELA